MSKPAKKYLLAVMVEEPPVKAYLERLRNAHGIAVWGSSLELHITLVPPFWTALPVSELYGRASRVAVRHTPFTLGLEGLGRFDNAQSTVFVPVVPSASLTALQANLETEMAGLAGPAEFPFNPHVTISDRTSAQQADTYMIRLRDEHIRLNMVCDRFSLLRKDDDGWRVTQHFVLR